MEKGAQRNAVREARLSAPRSGLRAEGTPSPSASEGSAALPFAIPLQPTPKAGRSLSHSQGQRELSQASGAQAGANAPLGLLTEEVDTETDSDLGGSLTHTTSHPHTGNGLQRTATYPLTYETYYNGGSSQEPVDLPGGAQNGSKADRKFEAAFANLALGKCSD